ncbi:C39 family peptidase [Paenibacillus sp. LHD-38]|uniref:C39 family peptidase n=1 Tax=Paenibacillus sp. LHD-38 TaxID=3072143 RepID=UPI00280E133E|nr:C39 family peptidase [Paenibacillus sp. LHD-38]MDQ8734865.1 C39 family peptidase [Paenibacillus sp. LHD-38]
MDYCGRYLFTIFAYGLSIVSITLQKKINNRGIAIMKNKNVFLGIIICVIIVSFLLLNSEKTSDTKLGVKKPVTMQGTITILNTDAITQLPIKNTIYTFRNEVSGEITEIMTDAEGKAKSSLLDYGTRYLIKQKQIEFPYKRSDAELFVEVNEFSQEFESTNQLLEHVKEVERVSEDGQIKISKVYMDVEELMQKPELPNGCEIVSLTAVLNYYGYEVSKTEMADKYLPKQPFTIKANKLYGPDPYKAYAGNPRDLKGAFFSYAPPIVKAAKLYLDAVGDSKRVADVSGSSREQIIEYLNKGIPVVVWTTLDLSKPKMNAAWYFNDTGDYFPAPVNLHVVVLNGYEDNLVHVMNPLKGQVTYNADTFFKSYDEMGSHALIVSNTLFSERSL